MGPGAPGIPGIPVLPFSPFSPGLPGNPARPWSPCGWRLGPLMLHLPQTWVWRRLLYTQERRDYRLHTRGCRDDRLHTRGCGDDSVYTHGCNNYHPYTRGRRDNSVHTRGCNNSCLAELHFWLSKGRIEAHSGNRRGARNPAAKSSCLFCSSNSSFASPHDNLLLQLSGITCCSSLSGRNGETVPLGFIYCAELLTT